MRQVSEILTISECAARWKCSVQTISRLLDEGLVHTELKVGERGNRMVRIRADDLDAFYDSRRQRKRQDFNRYRRAPQNGTG